MSSEKWQTFCLVLNVLNMLAETGTDEENMEWEYPI